MLFLVAILFCATNMRAIWRSDTIPAQRWIEQIKLENLGSIYQLTFVDKYRNSGMLSRDYNIYVIPRYSVSKRFSIDNKISKTQYTIHGFNPIVDQKTVIKMTTDRRLTSGGKMSVDVTGLVEQCYEKNMLEIAVVIEPSYYIEEYGNLIQCSYYEHPGNQDGFNNWLINYYETKLNWDRSKLYLEGDQSSVQYGQQYQVTANVKACYAVVYKLQKSKDKQTWVTLKSGSLDGDETKVGKTLVYKRVMTDNDLTQEHFRLEVKLAKGTLDPSVSNMDIDVYYPLTIDGDKSWQQKGSVFNAEIEDGKMWQIYSAYPVAKLNNGYVMPGCPTEFVKTGLAYTVKFLNADYTVLSTQTVAKGDDAQAPADPKMPGMVFKGWSKNFQNVQQNLTVIAQYNMGDDYFFYSEMSGHANELYPASGFAGADGKAMIGDKLTFTAEVRTPQESTLYYETASYNASTQEYSWTAPTNNVVGTFTAAHASKGQSRKYSKSVDVCYMPNTQYEKPFERKFAFRFYLYSAGAKIYSEPFEFDVYYAMRLKSGLYNPDFPSEPDALYAYTSNENIYGSDVTIPVRYGEQVFVERPSVSSGSGGLLIFQRMVTPSRTLESGQQGDEAYFVCPGETETISVTARKRVVVFDGVYGNGYPKQFDFSSVNKGKFNGYYAEYTECGSSVTVPEDPVSEGEVFLGWQAWSDEYSDDAYLNVPAGDDPIGFTAQWEDVPVIPTYTVRFYSKDGEELLSTQTVKEGDDAVPPVAPTISGMTFIGWNKSYNNIMGDTDLTALYSDDAATSWIVSYKDRTYEIDGDDFYAYLVEVVKDNQAAEAKPAVRSGYDFVCWSLSSKYDDYTPADLSNITADVVVYAKWKLKMGDVNRDGKVDATDVTLTSQFILGKNPTPFNQANADMNGDNVINVADIVELVKVITSQ